MKTQYSQIFLLPFLLILGICFLLINSPSFGQDKAATTPAAQVEPEKQAQKTAKAESVPNTGRLIREGLSIVRESPP